MRESWLKFRKLNEKGSQLDYCLSILIGRLAKIEMAEEERIREVLLRGIIYKSFLLLVILHYTTIGQMEREIRNKY